MAFAKTPDELKEAEADLKRLMLDTLFKGVSITADDIVLAYRPARRRLLASTQVIATINTDDATVTALSAAVDGNKADYETAAKSSFGLTSFSVQVCCSISLLRTRCTTTHLNISPTQATQATQATEATPATPNDAPEVVIAGLLAASIICVSV
jgi:hypothetical protein